MMSRVECTVSGSVLVCLPERRVRDVVCLLDAEGYITTTVSSVPELFDAVRSGAFALAVTDRRHAEIVRAIGPIQVIDITELFGFENGAGVPPGDGNQVWSSRVGERLARRLDAQIGAGRARGATRGASRGGHLSVFVDIVTAFRRWHASRSIHR